MTRKALSAVPLSIISLVAVISLPFLRALIGWGDLLPLDGEAFSEWHPYRMFSGSMFAHGQFPLWSHNLLAGFPLAAFPQAGCYYPLNVFFYLMDYGRASTWYCLVSLGLGAVFTWLLLRESGVSRLLSWMGALAYCFSGPMFFGMAMVQDFPTAVWLPAVFWLMLRVVQRRTIIDVPALALVYCLAFLAGGLENLLFASLIFPAWLWFHGNGRARWFLLLIPLILGLLLASPQVLITLTYLGRSLRWHEAATAGEAYGNNFHWLMGPFSYWDPGMIKTSHLYLGFLPLFGLALAPRSPALRRDRKAALIIGAVGWVFCFNPWPFSHLFQVIPLIGSLGSRDMRYRVVASLLLMFTVVAFRALDEAAESPARPDLKRAGWFIAAYIGLQLANLGLVLRDYHSTAMIFMILIPLVFLALSLAAGLLVSRRGRPTATRARAWLMAMVALSLVLPACVLAPLRHDAGRIFRPSMSLPEEAGGLSPSRLHVIYPIPTMILFFAREPDPHEPWNLLSLDHGPGMLCGAIRNSLYRTTQVLRRIGLVGFTFMDYKNISPAGQPLIDFLAVKYLAVRLMPVWSTDPLPLGSDPAHSQYLIQGKYVNPFPEEQSGSYTLAPGSQWRVSLDLQPGDRLVLNPGAGAMAGLDLSLLPGGAPPASAELIACSRDGASAACPLPVTTAGAYEIMTRVSDDAPGPVTMEAPRVTNPGRAYGLLKSGDYRLYENREALPRFGIYTEVRLVDPAHELDAMFDPDMFQPDRRLLMTPDQADPSIRAELPRTRQDNDVRVVRFDNNLVELSADTAAPSYLSIAEPYYPGWRAWVDGKETKISRADYAFQAVPLPDAGPHRIRLEFRPKEFKLGLFAALATIAAALVLLPFFRRHASDRPEALEAKARDY